MENETRKIIENLYGAEKADGVVRELEAGADLFDEYPVGEPLGQTLVLIKSKISKRLVQRQRRAFCMRLSSVAAGLILVAILTVVYTSVWDSGLSVRDGGVVASSELDNSIWDDSRSTYASSISDLNEEIDLIEEQLRDEDSQNGIFIEAELRAFESDFEEIAVADSFWKG